MRELLAASKAPTTWTSYDRSVSSFQKFHLAQYGVSPDLPYTPQSIAAFVSHLDLLNRAPQTISSTLFAIAHLHKISLLPDPTSSYLIKQVQRGSRRTHPTEDTRQPITKTILQRIYASVPSLAPSPYMSALYQSLFLLSFHAFLRAGEVTATGPSTSHVLTTQQVSVLYKAASPTGMTITFQSYKHSEGRRPKIQIDTHPHPCPVQALIHFLQFRGTSPGFIYVNPDNTLLTRQQFHQMLSRALRDCGLDPNHFNTHSFRIGAATNAAAMGLSPLQIRDMGRWKSDAFLKYIRQPVVHMSGLMD